METSRQLTQKEAALEAVNHIGWNQTGEIDPAWFAGHEDWYRIFNSRIKCLLSSY